MVVLKQKEKSEPTTERTDTSGNREGSESDTALLQNPDVSSESKVTNKTSDLQEKEEKSTVKEENKNESYGLTCH